MMRRFGTGPTAPLRAHGTIQSFLQAKKPTAETLRAALIACSTLEAAYKASEMPDYNEISGKASVKDAQELMDQVLEKYKKSTDSSMQITKQTLFEYFSSDYPPSTSSGIRVLDAFAKKSQSNNVPELVAMIPFRRALYGADFPGALEIMKYACGQKSNYKRFMDKKLLKIGSLWGIGMGATLTGVHSALTSGMFGQWESGNILMICAMFGTYLSALSLFGTMTIAGSKSALGEVLEWLPGTSPLYRFRHGMQLKMATFATELNRSLPENLGECSPQLLQDLQGMNLKPVETAEEAQLKEYWARAGAGFDWVEPDQDPATILWYEHMEKTRQNRLNSAYSRKDGEGRLLSWMSEVEREKQGLSIPHASLLDVDALKSNDGMKTFEQELAEDMKQIKEGKFGLLGDPSTDNYESEEKEKQGDEKDDGPKKSS